MPNKSMTSHPDTPGRDTTVREAIEAIVHEPTGGYYEPAAIIGPDRFKKKEVFKSPKTDAIMQIVMAEKRQLLIDLKEKAVSYTSGQTTVDVFYVNEALAALQGDSGALHE